MSIQIGGEQINWSKAEVVSSKDDKFGNEGDKKIDLTNVKDKEKAISNAIDNAEGKKILLKYNGRIYELSYSKSEEKTINSEHKNVDKKHTSSKTGKMDYKKAYNKMKNGKPDHPDLKGKDVRAYRNEHIPKKDGSKEYHVYLPYRKEASETDDNIERRADSSHLAYFLLKELEAGTEVGEAAKKWADIHGQPKNLKGMQVLAERLLINSKNGYYQEGDKFDTGMLRSDKPIKINISSDGIKFGARPITATKIGPAGGSLAPGWKPFTEYLYDKKALPDNFQIQRVAWSYSNDVDNRKATIVIKGIDKATGKEKVFVAEFNPATKEEMASEQFFVNNGNKFSTNGVRFYNIVKTYESDGSRIIDINSDEPNSGPKNVYWSIGRILAACDAGNNGKAVTSQSTDARNSEWKTKLSVGEDPQIINGGKYKQKAGGGSNTPKSDISEEIGVRTSNVTETNNEGPDRTTGKMDYGL